MKPDFIVRKSICLFCAATVLIGTLSGCSMSTDLFSSDNPFKTILGLPDDSNSPANTRPGEIPPEYTVPKETEPADEYIPETTIPVETSPEPEAPPYRPTKLTGEVTASVLNVREYPGTDYEIVRGIERGTRVSISEQVTVDGQVWGKVYDGWVSMQYVALDGVIEGSWYEVEAMNQEAYVYYIWDFHSDNTFVYTKCSLKPSEEFSIARTQAQGGGRYRYDGDTLRLELTHGDPVSIYGEYVEVGQYVILDTDIYGANMTWNTYYAQLSRGSLENIQKILRNP